MTGKIQPCSRFWTPRTRQLSSRREWSISQSMVRVGKKKRVSFLMELFIFQASHFAMVCLVFATDISLHFNFYFNQSICLGSDTPDCKYVDFHKRCRSFNVLLFCCRRGDGVRCDLLDCCGSWASLRKADSAKCIKTYGELLFAICQSSTKVQKTSTCTCCCII